MRRPARSIERRSAGPAAIGAPQFVDPRHDAEKPKAAGTEKSEVCTVACVCRVSDFLECTVRDVIGYDVAAKAIIVWTSRHFRSPRKRRAGSPRGSLRAAFSQSRCCWFEPALACAASATGADLRADGGTGRPSKHDTNEGADDDASRSFRRLLSDGSLVCLAHGALPFRLAAGCSECGKAASNLGQCQFISMCSFYII